MKKFLLFVLTLLISVGAAVAAPQPKNKKIKLADAVVYKGMALKKTPQGEGEITMRNCGTISGIFNGNEITNGKIKFENHRFGFTGDMTYRVVNNGVGVEGYSDLTDRYLSFPYYKNILVTIKNAKRFTVSSYNNKTYSSGLVIGDVRLVFCCAGNYMVDYYLVGYQKVSKELLAKIYSFVGVKRYRRTSDGKMHHLVINEKVNREVVKKATKMIYKFENGAIAEFDIKNDICRISRTNGDFVSMNNSNVESYKITSGSSVIENGKVTHTFENSYKYVGTVSGNIASYTTVTNFDTLLSFNGLDWAWADFKKYADDGVLVYANGKSEKIIDGITESEIARLEAERRAKEEAERLAREEEERKAEAARLAEEARQQKLLAQKVARLKKKYPAKFVDALAEDRFMEDMPYQLFVDFYGASALEIDYGSCGSMGGIRMLVYVLNGTYRLCFMSSRSGTFLSDWE